MPALDEYDWAQAFAVELVRLGIRAPFDQVSEVARGFYATEGADDPVEVARREFLTNLPESAEPCTCLSQPSPSPLAQ